MYLRNWLLLGPFSFNSDEYPGRWDRDVVDEDCFMKSDEATLTAQEPGNKSEGVEWERYASPADSRFPQVINLHDTYGQQAYSLAYAVAHVYSEKAVTGYSLYAGSDDYIKVWVNGRHVHSWARRSRSIRQDDDKVEGIALRKGWNKIVVKCVNLKGTWGFMLRLADEQDRPLVTE